MAKVKFNVALGEYGDLEDLYSSINNLELTTHIKTKAVYTDSESHNKLILLGNNFQYEGDFLVGGTITTIAFQNDDGKRVATVNHGKWDPADLLTAYGVDGFDGMVAYVLKGKDTMLGSKLGDLLAGEAGGDRIIGGNGRDLIYGEEGNDRMTGGLGSDTFFFLPGSGKDVITDFDAVGGELKQDFLNLPLDVEYTETQKGKNLVLDFGEGDTLTLLGVKAKDFGDEDIQSVM
ncbi:MAG: Hemolysin-type calcium-binding region [Rhizobium sp.]|nr:Hemolysin-type calcium-binding region [Rhizobium sp.]